MDFDYRVEAKFEGLKEIVGKAMQAIADEQEKQVFEPICKELALSLLGVKLLIKEVESSKPLVQRLNEQLQILNRELEEQEELFSKLKAYEPDAI